MGLVYRGQYGVPQMVELELEQMDVSKDALINKTAFPIGGGCLWFTDTEPGSNWILARGQALRQTEYPALYQLWGVKYGGGNDSGATQFSAPDLRQRFPLGKAASGTGATLGETGGTIDHTHWVAVEGGPGIASAVAANSEAARNPPYLTVNFAIRAR